MLYWSRPSWHFCCPIRKWSVYANEANIVKKIFPYVEQLIKSHAHTFLAVSTKLQYFKFSFKNNERKNWKPENTYSVYQKMKRGALFLEFFIRSYIQSKEQNILSKELILPWMQDLTIVLIYKLINTIFCHWPYINSAVNSEVEDVQIFTVASLFFEKCFNI